MDSTLDPSAAGDHGWWQLARRSLTDAQAAFYNAVCRRRRPMRISLDGRDPSGADDRVDPDTDEESDEDTGTAPGKLIARLDWQPDDLAGSFWVAHVDTPNGTLDLYLNDQLVSALLDHRCGTSSFPHMDPSSQQVIVEYALEPVIAYLSPGNVTRCAITKRGDLEASWPAHAFSLDVACRLNGDPAGRIRLIAQTAAAADALRNKIDARSPVVPDIRTSCASLVIHAGRTKLKRQVLESLAVTDVILVDQSALEDARAIMKVEGSSIAFVAEVGQYSLTTLERLNGATQDLHQSPEHDMTEFDEAADIEVDVIFEIGRLDISLEELSQLGPGHVFTLGRPLDIAVTIRANNARIGSGDIVFVDDKVGIQISKLKE